MVFLIICLILVIYFAIRYIKYLSSRHANAHPLVTTAHGNLPFLGHALDFMAERFLQTAEDYPKLHGPFVEFYTLSQRGILISDAAIAKECMLANPKKFRRLRAIDHSTEINHLTAGLFHSNGKIWSKIRKSTAPSFSNQNMSRKFPAVAHEVSHWMTRLAAQSNHTGAVDMTKECMSLTLRVITVVAFGLDVDDPIVAYFMGPDYADDIYDVFTFILKSATFPFPNWVWRLSPLFEYETKVLKANARFESHCAEILNHKRATLVQPTSMIDHMIAHHELTDDEIIANVKTFYMAGAETTAITLTWVCYYLCLNSHVVDKLRDEIASVFEALGHEDCSKLDIDTVRQMHYANGVVKEALRLAPPAFFIGLELEDGIDSHVLSNGIKVNQGDVIRMNMGGMMLLDHAYDDAKVFNPDRWMPGAAGLDKAEDYFLPFGFGPRICPGMTLALTEAVLAVAMLAHTFDMALDCPVEEIKRVIVFAATSNKMPIKFTKRKM